MQNNSKLVRILCIWMLLHGNFAIAAPFTVSNTNDSGAGSLRQAITDLNNTGTPGVPATSNTISFTLPGPGTSISLGSDLPVITKGVTISVGSGPNPTITGNNRRAIATSQASVSMSNVSISGSRATGGAGTAGGGGGLGAGGAIYVDLGTTFTLSGSSLANCSAQGGAGSLGNSGSSANGGGGGGASFVETKDASSTTGGGTIGSTIYGGRAGSSNGLTGGAAGSSRPATVPSTTYTGYDGGTNAYGTVNNGSGAGSVLNGGYFAGAGGPSGVEGGGGSAGGYGGAGGDGGATGGTTYNGAGGRAAAGAGGGGYGGGGGGAVGTTTLYSAGSGGGGGGFGGGGGNAGGANFAGGNVTGGYGGGGGYGAGGGGGAPGANFGPGAGGRGGNYGGNGGYSGTAGTGGGGGALGGSIFVGDTATLNIGDSVSITTAATPLIAGAAGGVNATVGTTEGPDIFLFKNAQVVFNGTGVLAVPYSIKCDTNTNVPTSPTNMRDFGVTINGVGNSITFTSTANNYYGGTTITNGTLTASVANLPFPNNTTTQASVNIQAGGTLNFSNGVSAASTNIITNSGNLNITGTTTLNTLGSITNSGTMTLTAALSGTGTLTNTGVINVNSLGVLTKPTTFTNTGTTNLNGTGNISGAYTGGTGSILTVGNTSASGYTTSGNISGFSTVKTVFAGTVFTINNTVTGGTSSTFNIGVNTTTALNNGASLSGFNTVIIDGMLSINAGATYTLGSSHNLTGSGTISNSGQFYINSSDVAFSGSFTNNQTGNLIISGTPNIIFSGGAFTNQGNIISNFSTSNSLPLIQLPMVVIPSSLDLSHGIITVGYNNTYIAEGDYPLITAGTPPVTGVAILPQPTRYVSNWSLSTVGNTLFVSVERDGFGDHALTESAAAIGDYLEELGSGSPSQFQIDLLNALELIDTDQELTVALLSLLPPQYNLLVTSQLLDSLIGNVEIRLASLNNGYYSAGENDATLSNNFWVRPFSTSGKQGARGDLQAYTDSSHGWILGIDSIVNSNFTLGLAGSYAKTYVEDTLTPTTNTNIHTYLATCYASMEYPGDTYLDALFSGGVSNYHGVRTIQLPGYMQTASANYSSQQFTVKAMVSKYLSYDMWQLTPRAMMQYIFIRQPLYTEDGADGFDNNVEANNMNLFRMGLGADLSVPFTTRSILSIPVVYAMAYYDAKGGAETTNTSFVSGGPILTNTVQSAKLLYKLGFRYELKLSERFQVVGNYDLLWRQKFQGQEAFINLRFTF